MLNTGEPLKLSLPKKSLVRSTDHPEKTSAVYHGVTSSNLNNKKLLCSVTSNVLILLILFKTSSNILVQIKSIHYAGIKVDMVIFFQLNFGFMCCFN